jgi:PQQ-dependent catabolism-associated beta-propeller protein
LKSAWNLSGAALAAALCVASSGALAQGVAWVSSEKDNAITLIDLAKGEVAGTVATCKRPRHMQLTPDGAQIAVACSDSGQADFIDVKTRQSSKRMGIGEDPEVFDLSADGKTLFVSLEEDAALGFVDLGSGKTTAEVKVGGEPEGVLVSRDGKLVFVTSEATNSVVAVDAATRKVAWKVKTGKRPRRFAMSPDGSQLWVSNELDASVSIIDVGGKKVVQTLKFEVPGARKEDITPVGLAMTRDGKKAFVGLGRANHVAFVDVASLKVEKLVLVGKRAWSVALNKAESQLVVVNGLSDDVSLVDVASAKATKSIKVGRVPHTAVIVE